MGKSIKKAFKKVVKTVVNVGTLGIAGDGPFEGFLGSQAGLKAQQDAAARQAAFEAQQQRQQQMLSDNMRALADANAATETDSNVQFGGGDAADNVLGRRKRTTSSSLGII